MLQLIGTFDSNNNFLFFYFQDILSIMFATSEELETPYMATYNRLVHRCADLIIDVLDGILQKRSTIVYSDHPAEYHDDGGSSSAGPSHRQSRSQRQSRSHGHHSEFHDRESVHPSHHQSPAHHQPTEFHDGDSVHPPSYHPSPYHSDHAYTEAAHQSAPQSAYPNIDYFEEIRQMKECYDRRFSQLDDQYRYIQEQYGCL